LTKRKIFGEAKDLTMMIFSEGCKKGTK